MNDPARISARVSTATKEELDRFAARRGLKRSFVVEQALLYFMEAGRDLPDEALLPSRSVLDDDAFERIATLLESPPAPTEALRELMRGQGR